MKRIGRAVGAVYGKDEKTSFTVWAPLKKSVQLHLVGNTDRYIDLDEVGEGYWQVVLHDAPPGTRYFFRVDGSTDIADPASRYQPEGVHGPSEVIELKDDWNKDRWKGLDLTEYVIYELHVGTFTSEGSFEAIIPRLDELKSWGMNAIELMPVCQFPGSRNWGYDGVYPYAVQNSYGGPGGLRKLVAACHEREMAVILDVVYNHQGPEGNYFTSYGPYFSDRYHTPWGDAINFDSAWSDAVRRFYVDNTVYWLEEFHVDALRFDAIHAIFDASPENIWRQLNREIRELEQKHGRRFYLFAESDLNDPVVLEDADKRGYGFDAQWLDDFHHNLYKLICPEDDLHYIDFGSIEQMVKAYKEGFVHSGEEWVDFRKRYYGASSAGIRGGRFVSFFSNHDQVGNRPDGLRNACFLSLSQLKLAAAAVLLSPYIPMFFMGDEYGATTPFFYFVSHSDKELIEAVRLGRIKEFSAFGLKEPPDAQSEETFSKSILRWEEREQPSNAILLDWHRFLLELRKTQAALKNDLKEDLSAAILGEKTMIMQRQSVDHEESIIALLHFDSREVELARPAQLEHAELLAYSEGINWVEEGKQHDLSSDSKSILMAPWSVAIYLKKAKS